MKPSTEKSIVMAGMAVTSAGVLAGLFSMNLPEFLTTKIAGMITLVQVGAGITAYGIYALYKNRF